MFIDQTNEGDDFYVGFFQNQYGYSGRIFSPFLWVTTKENTEVKFSIFTINGVIFTGFARPQKVTYVKLPTEVIVFNSTRSEWFKGIRIKTKHGKKIVVYGQYEKITGSNDAYLALPVVTLPGVGSHEYIVASFKGNSDNTSLAIGSVALIIGTENDTEIVIEASDVIHNAFAPAATDYQFVPGVPASLTIQRFQTFYIQVRGGDISGTRIIANKPISVFSGHECATVPLSKYHYACDMLIEQIPPIATWGFQVATVPLKTKGGDIIKIIASQDATRVNVTRTNIDDGAVTNDTFILDAGKFKELIVKDFSLIQSDHPIGVFQIATSHLADKVSFSDPLMLLVPPYKQYRNSYAVATAPSEPPLRPTRYLTTYVNYTNIAVPAEYFNVSLLTINNKTANAIDFKPIRRSDNSIWGYGAQLILDEGAQVIQHQNPNAFLLVTLYGFGFRKSWGCTGGMGLASIAGT